MHHPGEPGNNGNDIFFFPQCFDIWRERKKKEKKKKETRRKSGRSVVSSKDKIFVSA